MKNFDDKDEFWSLDSMLPPSAFQKKKISTSCDVSAVEIEIDGEEKSYPKLTSEEGKKLDFGEWLKKRNGFVSAETKNEKTVLREYIPQNPLIYKVTVYENGTKKQFNERFLCDGERLYSKTCPFKGNRPYRAIFPQYASMNDEQTECYIGFRTSVREGAFPKVDEEYILLLVYELINLTDKDTPEKRAEILASLICAYTDVSEKLFSDMCNYLADLCLIYEIPLPGRIFGNAYSKILKSARIKEFFIDPRENGSVSSLAVGISRYDYRSGKFYPENKQYFDGHIEKAVSAAIEHIAKTDSRFRENKNECCRLEHESFHGAYRTNAAKKRIVMELACVTRDEDVKRVTSELTKYAENCIRAALGIKPRLTVSYVNREIKNIIKQYFAQNLPYIAPVTRKTEKKSEPEQIPDYEKMYEPTSTGFSFDDAIDIEKSSWSITEKLVTAFDTEEEESENISPEIQKTEQHETRSIDPIIEGLSAIANGNTAAFNGIAKSNGILPDALADKIKEFLIEKLGDVAIEYDGSSYTVSEWYTDDINDLLAEAENGG